MPRKFLALLQAWGLVLLIVTVEYGARRLLAPSLPTLGTWRVNDLVVSAMGYSFLVVLTAPEAERHLIPLWRSVCTIVAKARAPSAWVGMSLLLGVGWLTVVDHWLWGPIHLPVWEAPSNPITLFPQTGSVLRALCLITVNGLLVPLAEERLWRGLIQPRIIRATEPVAGVLLTSALFSLKHAIVDASLGRLLTLFVFGLIAGHLALRGSWKDSAFAHSAANTVATLMLLVMTGGDV